MTAGALDGIKVLEFASYVSGPFAGMLLSDLGAEVGLNFGKVISLVIGS